MNNISKTIEWAEKSWNPISGCENKCPYCYARGIYRRFKKSFKPEFHPDRIHEPQSLEKPSRIFVCSVSDLWGKGIKPEWRQTVFDVMRKTSLYRNAIQWHTYFALTKQPQRIPKEKIPDNLWIGVSVTEQKDMARWLELVSKVPDNGRRFLCFEPILGYFELLDFFNKTDRPDWMIMGALTGPRKNKYLTEWTKGWAVSLLSDLAVLNRPIFVKNNLRGILPDEKVSKEIAE